MTYDLHPKIDVRGSAVSGWNEIRRLDVVRNSIALCVETYPGADTTAIAAELTQGRDVSVVAMRDLLLEPDARRALLAPFLTDDRVFGHLAPPETAPLTMRGTLDQDALSDAKNRVARQISAGRPVMVIGPGARLVLPDAPLIFADMPRWEIQARMRRGEGVWLATQPETDMLRAFKRGYFVEWRIADRWKMELFDTVDVFLDTTRHENPVAVRGDEMRDALASVADRPFRCVPFFDPGVWGGQWMKKEFDLPDDPENYAWGFDCVPEENSLLLSFDGGLVEIPAINLVLRHPEALLGKPVFDRFGAEFPIRFDFLDTIEGGNLSLQVHPDAAYAHETFGLNYTQDESYYILAAEPDAHVYLGLKDGITSEIFFDALEAAQSGKGQLNVEAYVNRLPAKRHAHFSIPAGTIHCSGAGCVVLEISATPYIFTFKLWDWGRLGLDGLPRPIHAEHGRKVLREDRDRSWVEAELLSLRETLSDGAGVIEERTGLHPLEFIETRRYWFNGSVTGKTGDSVHVLNLVQGDGAVIESPANAFDPFTVGFAETFIIPAKVGAYTFGPTKEGQECAMIRASVRI